MGNTERTNQKNLEKNCLREAIREEAKKLAEKADIKNVKIIIISAIIVCTLIVFSLIPWTLPIPTTDLVKGKKFMDCLFLFIFVEIIIIVLFGIILKPILAVDRYHNPERWLPYVEDIIADRKKFYAAEKEKFYKLIPLFDTNLALFERLLFSIESSKKNSSLPKEAYGDAYDNCKPALTNWLLHLSSFFHNRLAKSKAPNLSLSAYCPAPEDLEKEIEGWTKAKIRTETEMSDLLTKIGQHASNVKNSVREFFQMTEENLDLLLKEGI